MKVFACIYFGNYLDDGMIVDNACPGCHWDPYEATPEGRMILQHETAHPGEDLVLEADCAWILGMMWSPGALRGIGAYFQIYHCQNCGVVYATHVN